MLPPFRPFRNKPITRLPVKARPSEPSETAALQAHGPRVIGKASEPLMPRLSDGAARAGTGGLAPERIPLKQGRKFG